MNAYFNAENQPRDQQTRVLRDIAQHHNSSKKFCAFCKCNRETINVYTSHNLKSKDGKIECPILKKYVCSICGATGENAHTISYCPIKKSASAMKNKSIVDACGKLRKF